MAPILPPDIILMVCEELGNQRDFSTLFNLAVSAKYFTGPALLWMYKTHAQSSFRGGDNEPAETSNSAENTSFGARIAQRNDYISKWAQQWRAIILSSLKKTAYPYCLYIQSLDLGNLAELFADTTFRDTAQEDFFAGDMSMFLFEYEALKRKRTRAGQKIRGRLHVSRILEMVGESISKYVSDSAKDYGGTAALEELHGEIPQQLLSSWVGRLSRLRYMKVWDGKTLDKSVSETIRANCPDFSELTLYSCTGEKVDTNLSEFISGLRPNSLRALQVTSQNDLGHETFLSLAHHQTSLKELAISDLKPNAVKKLSVLASCTSLESLNLQDATKSINLEMTQNDVFLDIVSWLSSLKSLKHIRLDKFIDGPAILTAVCLSDKVCLKSLGLVYYTFINNRPFHQALAQQENLETVELRADPEDCERDDIDTLVTSLCSLTALKDLKLLDISDYFQSIQIQALALSLPQLEYFSVSGYGVDDEIWPALSTLHHLRSIAFHAVTSFTYEGIMGYVQDLRESNTGLQLSVMCAILESDLSIDEQQAIRDAIAERVDGRFDFVLYTQHESDMDSDLSD